MCFSATVSYSAAALLIPAGLYTMRLAKRLHHSYMMLALMPLLFGIQQGCEGRLWEELTVQTPTSSQGWALAFLFFSHFLWLVWVPLASYRIETDCARRRLFRGVALLGVVVGGLVYLPLLYHPEWVSAEVIRHSIVYHVATLNGDAIPVNAERVIYASIILLPLLYSSLGSIRRFGLLVAFSMVPAIVLYDYAFISVWCLYAAILSLSLVYLLRAALKGRDESYAEASL